VNAHFLLAGTVIFRMASPADKGGLLFTSVRQRRVILCTAPCDRVDGFDGKADPFGTQLP
jgi:hypothetical protein